MGKHRRAPVLFPQGQPKDPASVERCARLVHYCGGDLGRVFDEPTSSLEAFIRHISRLPLIRNGHEPQIVVLTRTHPVELAVERTRQMLERAVPSLSMALWALYLEPQKDPDFFRAATRRGVLGGPLEACPVWISEQQSQFLLLSPLAQDATVVARRAAQLMALERGRVSSPNLDQRLVEQAPESRITPLPGAKVEEAL